MNVVVQISTNELRGIVSNCTRICRNLGFTADEIPKILGYTGKEELGLELLIRELSKCRDGSVVERCKLIIRIDELLRVHFGDNAVNKKKWLDKRPEGFKETSRSFLRSGETSRLKIVVSLLQSGE